MRQVTKVNPLITNFMTPKTPEVVSENNIKMIYDPQSQITIYMGGNSGPSRSYDGYKKTWKEVVEVVLILMMLKDGRMIKFCHR